MTKVPGFLASLLRLGLNRLSPRWVGQSRMREAFLRLGGKVLSNAWNDWISRIKVGPEPKRIFLTVETNGLSSRRKTRKRG